MAQIKDLKRLCEFPGDCDGCPLVFIAKKEMDSRIELKYK